AARSHEYQRVKEEHTRVGNSSLALEIPLHEPGISTHIRLWPPADSPSHTRQRFQLSTPSSLLFGCCCSKPHLAEHFPGVRLYHLSATTAQTADRCGTSYCRW